MGCSGGAEGLPSSPAMHSVGSRDLLLVLYTFVVHFARDYKISLGEYIA